MAKYKIKNYYLKKDKNNLVKVMATVFKYRFCFLVDIIQEELDSDLKCRFETNSMFYFVQFPKNKKEAMTILKCLNKRLTKNI